MSIILTNKPSVQVEPGVYTAVCFRIVHLGTQPSDIYEARDKIALFWELPGVTHEFDGEQKPLAISKIYTFSMNKKATLRKDLAAWRGRDFNEEELKGFEMKKLLAQPCQLQVIHNEHGKAKVATIMAQPKGAQRPGVTNPLVEYSILEGKNKTYEALPEWVRTMCDQCAEWTGKPAVVDNAEDKRTTASGEDDDQPPF